METVTVTDVEKSGTGWYEISLQDGRTVSTKNQTLADAAFAGRGTEVEVEVNEVKRGTFTNHYLNKIGDLSDEKKGAAAPRNGTSKRAATPAQNDERQKIIEREWAMGRAVELYNNSIGGTKNFDQLGESDFVALEFVADRLLQYAKK